jgi:quercetin dioxygenase-like cupin family protein
MRIARIVLFSTMLLAQDPLAVDPRHYTVALDNSRVRVLHVHYQPGGGSPMHEHSAGVRIFVTDIHNKFFLPDGSTSEASRRAGEIIWAEPVRHGNRNVGDHAVEILEMELKGVPKHPARAMPLSPSPDPSETVVLENEFVRVLRVKMDGHSKNSMHAHPDRVMVSMSEQHLRATGEDGRSDERHRSRGQVFWAPANSQATENLSEAPLENVVVELKNY